jgi:hypothetical protein
MTETIDEIIETAEHRAARGIDPQAIASGIIAGLKEGRGEPGSLLDKLDARIGEMDAQAAERDHPKLKKGASSLRKAVELVRQMLDPESAQEELTDLAEKIRVCVKKSDNYAITAGQHLREARERCRTIGRNFNEWCANADLGIKRRRIYQLMGPDPIAAERRDENHNVEPENVQSLHIAQLTNVAQPEPLPPAVAPAESATETLFRRLQDLFRQLPPAVQFDFVEWATAVATDEVPPVRELAA